MSLEELRDLFIVIYALAGIGAIIFLSILVFLVFRKIRSILDSGRETLGNVRNISSVVSDNIVKPLVSISSFLQGLRQALEFISRAAKREEEKRSGPGE